MLFVVCAHIVGLAVLMSAKMDLPRRIIDPPTTIELIPDTKAPEPAVRPAEPRQPRQTTIHTPPTVVPAPVPDKQIVDSTPAVPDFGEIGKLLATPQPPVEADPAPAPAPVRTRAQLVTPASELKPPYPQSKLLTGEEAQLTLRLGIDSNGRVVSVEPVGRADRVFLEAARRHLMAHWRYKPAMEGGHAIATTAVITLRFELDG
jgi:protein TonB